ncbi:MAG TPA: MerR family transcriptional regulator [Solirubrobacteraceae bacterium]|jgi:DNA-binding transcriptional MerR regulator
MASEPVLRIGELSRRTGVSPELLRAWERRYGFLSPTRTGAGLRLYSDGDVDRVRLMREHLGRGLAAAEAAALAARGEPGGAHPADSVLPLDAARRELIDALDRFDEPAAQAVLDRVLAVATVDTLLGGLVLPYLSDLGDRWERGEASIAQEHFASAVLRGRLLGLARGWGLGLGPLALLACLPGEQHDLGLIAFGLTLRSRGWRVVYLGQDAPLETVAEAGRRLDPALVVLSAVDPGRLQALAEPLRRLAAVHRLALGGAGAAGFEPAGVLALGGDPIAEAKRVTALVRDA